jgi:hypothetical protein
MATTAQTPMAPVVAFGAGADERPGGGKRWGARDALKKRKDGEERGAVMTAQHPFKRARRGVEEGTWAVGGGHVAGGGGGKVGDPAQWWAAQSGR